MCLPLLIHLLLLRLRPSEFSLTALALITSAQHLPTAWSSFLTGFQEAQVRFATASSWYVYYTAIVSSSISPRQFIEELAPF